MEDLAGRVAFVTGGANGIGLGLARALLGQGCPVAFLPVRAVSRLHKQMGKLGQQVELQLIDGGDHDASWLEASTDGAEWIEQRIEGEQPASTCPARQRRRTASTNRP